MRAFLAALLLAYATVLFGVAAVPYRAPAVAVVKDQARLTAEPVAVAAVEEPEIDSVAAPVVPVMVAALPPVTIDGAAPVALASAHPSDLQLPAAPVPLRPKWTAETRPDTALLDRARKYKGTNPTGWARLWCAKFMAMIAPDLARKLHNPNLARDWAKLPKTAPRPGAIVVLTRGGGGHIGVLAGFDKRGNPLVVSGNWIGRGGKRTVAEHVYSKHRVIAYVSPNG